MSDKIVSDKMGHSTERSQDAVDQQRVLIWAPFGRDACVLGRILGEAGIARTICRDLQEVRDQLRHGAGAILMTEETLSPPVAMLAEDIEAQPSWSALPLILLATGDETAQQRLKIGLRYLGARRNITILARPSSPVIIATTLESALRARGQQYIERDLLARLEDLNENLEERVNERTREVQELAISLTVAEQRERRRISQVLHDGLQQILYSIHIHLHLAQRDASPGEHPQWLAHVVKVQGMLDEAIRTTRTLLVDLSPPALQNEDLQAVLEWLALRMKELHGLHVTLEVHRRCRVDDEGMRVLLVQVVRELLFNIVKHASIDRARIELSAEDHACIIRVIDEGEGFDPEAVEQRLETTGGFGLSSIRERLRLLGGRIEIDSAPGAGTRTTIVAPLAAAKPSEKKAPGQSLTSRET